MFIKKLLKSFLPKILVTVEAAPWLNLNAKEMTEKANLFSMTSINPKHMVQIDLKIN
jgi:hypothetical protein